MLWGLVGGVVLGGFVVPGVVDPGLLVPGVLPGAGAVSGVGDVGVVCGVEVVGAVSGVGVVGVVSGVGEVGAVSLVPGVGAAVPGVGAAVPGVGFAVPGWAVPGVCVEPGVVVCVPLGMVPPWLPAVPVVPVCNDAIITVPLRNRDVGPVGAVGGLGAAGAADGEVHWSETFDALVILNCLTVSLDPVLTPPEDVEADAVLSAG